MKSYYENNADLLGWSQTSANLDKERLTLLEKNLTGKKVLDIACATGIYVDYLSRKGYEAHGIDFVSKFINDARKKRKGKFKVGSAEKLPFKDGEFDSVYMFDILEHGDDIKMLKEARRVVKKRILVIVPRQVDAQLEQSGVIFRHYLDKTHLREYVELDFENLAAKTNLKLVDVKKVHLLYNETVFMSLFDGPLLLKKVIRKLILLLLPKKKYYTEFFVVFEKV